MHMLKALDGTHSNPLVAQLIMSMSYDPSNPPRPSVDNEYDPSNPPRPSVDNENDPSNPLVPQLIMSTTPPLSPVPLH